MKNDFQMLISKYILCDPESQYQQLKATTKNNITEITSDYWEKGLSLVFIQHNESKFEGFYRMEKWVNNELCWDMPIDLDVEIEQKRGKFYNWWQCLRFDPYFSDQFDSVEELLYCHLFEVLLRPIKKQRTLNKLYWFCDEGTTQAKFQDCPKYRLTGNTLEHHGKMLYQIQALRSIPKWEVKIGDLGGFIEQEANLSQTGNCWVSHSVCGFGIIHGNAVVQDDAFIQGNVDVRDRAIIGDQAVLETASKAKIIVQDQAEIRQKAMLVSSKHWTITVREQAKFTGEAYVRNKFCDCDLVFSGKSVVSENLEQALMNDKAMIKKYCILQQPVEKA